MLCFSRLYVVALGAGRGFCIRESDALQLAWAECEAYMLAELASYRTPALVTPGYRSYTGLHLVTPLTRCPHVPGCSPSFGPQAHSAHS
jgi:hypothetical protein